jgi:hypothetical protein
VPTPAIRSRPDDVFLQRSRFLRRRPGASGCSRSRQCYNVTLLPAASVPPARPLGVKLMRWFRSHAKWGSCLALGSLALQLALSFGHIHLKDVAGSTRSSTAAAAVAVAADEQRSAAAAADGDEHENGYCAIYAINALISSAQQSQPPALLLPPPISSGQLALGYELALAAFHHVLPQARAPPVA